MIRFYSYFCILIAHLCLPLMNLGSLTTEEHVKNSTNVVIQMKSLFKHFLMIILARIDHLPKEILNNFEKPNSLVHNMSWGLRIIAMYELMKVLLLWEKVWRIYRFHGDLCNWAYLRPHYGSLWFILFFDLHFLPYKN